MAKVIISCAVTGAIHTPSMSPYLPITPEQIAQVAREYRVYYAPQRSGEAAGDYSVDHSSILYLMGPDGRFIAPGQLRERFRQARVDGSVPVGVYCGSGVTAAHEVLALELAGFRAALYPGSWSEWSQRGLPSERG